MRAARYVHAALVKAVAIEDAVPVATSTAIETVVE
jgi:hypothetical protein